MFDWWKTFQRNVYTENIKTPLKKKAETTFS